jgi:hypothetical protein
LLKIILCCFIYALLFACGVWGFIVITSLTTIHIYVYMYIYAYIYVAIIRFAAFKTLY